MATRKLARAAWGPYFDALSKPLVRGRRIDYAELRVLSPEDGAQPHTGWLPLAGITYDHKDDVLEIAVEHLDHLVFHPVEIYVDELKDGVVASLAVVQADGTREIIELR
jgi:hypothetical protein